MTHTKEANKSKILALILGLTMCLALMLGIAMASPTNTVYAAGEDGTAPTIIRTGGNDVDRKNHMGNLPAAIKGKPRKMVATTKLRRREQNRSLLVRINREKAMLHCPKDFR